MRATFVVILFVLYSVVCNAQRPTLYFEKLTKENGLTHNKVNCILQDKRGFIWIGTDDGLNRYDGKNFLRFRHMPGDTTSISGNIITDLLEDRDQVLWIATLDGGITKYDYRLAASKQFRQYSVSDSDIPLNIINALAEDGQGNLWLASGGRSVLRMDKKKESFVEPVKTGTKTVMDIVFDHKGILWAGRQGGGLLKVNPVTLSYEEDQRYKDLYAKLPHASVTALFKDSRQQIWFGSWDRILYKYDPQSGKEYAYNKTAESFSFNNDEILCFAEDRQGRIWMGGKTKGLHIYYPSLKRFYNYSYDVSKEGGISDDQVNCIFIDRDERIWLGTNKGVNISNPRKQQFRQTFLPSSSARRIIIYDFYEDASKNIWMGTSEGIYIKDPDKGSLQHIPLNFKNQKLHVTSFLEDDGKLYIGTNYSLFLFDKKTRAISLLPGTEKDEVMNQIIDSRVVSVIRDNIEGHPVLLTSPYGHYITYYDLVNKKWVSRLDTTKNIISRYNLKDNLVRKFLKLNNQTWLATGKEGLGLWKKEIDSVVYFNNKMGLGSNHVFDIIPAENGNLWVSTYGGGVHHFNTATRTFNHIPSENLSEGICTDKKNNIWLVSNGDIHKYDIHQKKHSSFNLPDLEKTGGVRGRIFCDSRGYLYASGINYFIVFHPDSIYEAEEHPRVVLTGFTIFNDPQNHLLNNSTIHLKQKENYFTFEFAAPYFVPNGEVYFSYMLQGFDKDWIETPRNHVSYSNLDGGNYTFKVRASNTPGVWNYEFASVHLNIIPPVWKRTWFLVLVILIMITIIYLLYRYRINELLQRQSIRNKIAQDLHDNVGSTLSSISVYSQVARIYHTQQRQKELETTLEKISLTSSDMISELNDTVWAINPRNDHMQLIIQRMESFARPLLVTQNIRFNMEVDPDVYSVNLDMDQRKNFYLIYKEIINNILKYSKATVVTVSIFLREGWLHMNVEDDGCGFDAERASSGYISSDALGGNGLKNMHFRTEQMKGKIKVSSSPGKGTRVNLRFPIT